MKVLFLVRNNFTNDSRVLREAETLRKNGYSITVLCLSNGILPTEQNSNGIQIKRIAYSKNKYISYIKYIAGALAYRKKYDVVHCHDLDTLPIGVLLGGKAIYDAHEYETETAHISGLRKKLYKIVERFFINFADSVITVSDSIAQEYARLYGIFPYLVMNCPPHRKQNKKNIFREKFGIKDNQIIFLYQGGLMPNRGIEHMIQAFGRLEEDKVIVFMGNGALEEKVKRAVGFFPNIYHMDAVAPSILLDYTSSADVGLCLLENTCLNHYYAAPNKFFEYAMAGIPVIISDSYELKRIINHYKNGLAGELFSIIKNITPFAISEMRKGAEEVAKVYNWERQEANLLEAYAN